MKAGETIAVIGANGAGKTSLMRSITGLLKGEPGSVTFRNEDIGHLPADEVMTKGIAMVPEGRRLFPSLSVEENLLIGTYGRAIKAFWSLAKIFELFPILADGVTVPERSYRGGQQQMVAIGRALMSNPRVLLCDEISLGLAPVVIKDIYLALARVKAAGASVIVVEQDIGQAMKVADRVYCMMEGESPLPANLMI